MALLVFFVVILLFFTWLALLASEWKRTYIRSSSPLLLKALAIWPLLIVDATVRAASVEKWFAVAGMFKFVAVLLFIYVLRYWCEKMQPHWPLNRVFSGLVLTVTLAAQLPLLLVSINHHGWISNTPVAQVTEYWQVYLCYVIQCIACLIVGLRLFDVSKRYHNYLSWQAVDIKRYFRKPVTFSAMATILVTLVGFLLVLVTALGLFALNLWPALVDLVLAASALIMLAVIVFIDAPLPSPIRYKVLTSASIKPTNRDHVLVKTAQDAMVKSKAYKIIGYTLEEFSERCKCDPTDLVIALRRTHKQDFRAFIFKYRMEYARNIVMRSDASIAAVAKRLGFHSEKFLSGPFLSYLERRN